MNWASFKEFLAGSCGSKRYIKDKVRTVKRFAFCLFNEDFSAIQKMPESKRNLVMCSLSSLAKFLGIHEQFKGLVKAYGLKWKSVKAEDLMLNRMRKAEAYGSVLEWVKPIKVKIPRLRVFMDFAVCSGLRYEEAIQSYNLIIDLAKSGRLSEYYNSEKEALEHFKFKEAFNHRTKKAFVTLLPKTLMEKVSRQERLTVSIPRNEVKRNGFKMRFGDLREYYATFMTKWLSQSEIDFLQGRISGSVFMRNYFNPALISDLKDRVFKGLAEIQNKL